MTWINLEEEVKLCLLSCCTWICCHGWVFNWSCLFDWESCRPMYEVHPRWSKARLPYWFGSTWYCWSDLSTSSDMRFEGFWRLPCYSIAKCQIQIIDPESYCFDGNMQGPSTWLNLSSWLNLSLGISTCNGFERRRTNERSSTHLPSFIRGDWVKSAVLGACWTARA